MIDFKNTLIILIAANFIVLSIYRDYSIFPYYSPNFLHGLSQDNDDFPSTNFTFPFLAFHILSQLDVYEPIDKSFLREHTPDALKSFNHSSFGIQVDDNFCDAHRAQLIDEPESVFESQFIWTNYNLKGVLREKVIPEIGYDSHREALNSYRPRNRSAGRFLAPMDPRVTVFLTNPGLFAYFDLGKHFSCLSQFSNFVPGNEAIGRKDKIAEASVVYAEKYKTKPECFNFDKFFPKTWILSEKEQCEDFFKEFNSEEYQELKNERRIVYIRKMGSGFHRAMGVEPVIDNEEKELREIYQNGTNCGKEDKNYIIQNYVHNPLLLNGHKFDFRIYLLLASTNPTIAYYHDGFLRLSLFLYDVESNDKKVLLTNTDLSNEVFEEAANGTLFNGMNETEIRYFQMWNFTRLHVYLMEQGLVKDPNWLDNYLRPEFMKAMIHLIKMTEDSFLKSSVVYELFGLDFMLDDKLNLWFIECNSAPALKGTSEEKEEFLKKMLIDHFEIVYMYMRSRMARVIRYVNKLTVDKNTVWIPPKEVKIYNLEQRRKEFKEIIKNYLEDEYYIEPDNGFVKIVDGNLKEKERYMNLLDENCL